MGEKWKGGMRQTDRQIYKHIERGRERGEVRVERVREGVENSNDIRISAEKTDPKLCDPLHKKRGLQPPISHSSRYECPTMSRLTLRAPAPVRLPAVTNPQPKTV